MSPATIDDAAAMRRADARLLAQALADGRARLLRLLDGYAAALGPALEVRYAPELNPPLWELGHVAWFEERWNARNTQRLAGARADPEAPRAAPLRRGADALYDSSRVAHAARWRLDLPDLAHTLADAARIRERTLRLLDDAPGDDDALYFPRLALFHEDMHGEAWVYMAQQLGIDLRAALGADGPAALAGDEAAQLELPAQRVTLGHAGDGFAFDNELLAHEVELEGFTIDAQPLRWSRYLPFVEAGGYEDPRLWTREGWAWRQQHGSAHPRHLWRGDDGAWQVERFGRWQALDPAQPAMHLSGHEAQAWCAWAGRRLPAEAEWEAAAAGGDARFEWGAVWEWTASPFAPYAGFAAHPYRDYSSPWFDGRPVLRGGSWATAPRMKHARYRNYFPAARNDVFAGFRSCARH